MKRRVLWVVLVLSLLAAGAYGQNVLVKRLIGTQDVNWATGGTGAVETFTYTTKDEKVLTLNKIDATFLKFRRALYGLSYSVEDLFTGEITVWDATTLASKITALGSNSATIRTGPGTISITSNLTIPANITLKPIKGSVLAVATGKTLTINGPIEAGPYQIFSWTGAGAIALSSCPNEKYPLEWMGGLPDGTDIAAALTKYAASFAGTRRLVKLGAAIYTLKTPVVITTSPQSLNIIGSGDHDSQIKMAMTASDIGITIGTTSYWAYSLTMKDFSFTGAAGSCLTALKISQASPANLDLNFWCGSAGYVCWIENCVWMDAKIYLRNHLVQGYAGYGEPAKGLYLTNDASVGGANASRLYFDSEAFGVNPALEISPYYAGGGGPCGGLEVTGCAENWTGSPVVINGKGATSYAGSQNLYLTFRNFYIETSENNVGGTIPISNAALIDLSGLIVNDSKCQVQLSYTKGINIMPPAYFAGGLTISPDCQGTVVGPITAETLIDDYAGDTVYLGGPSSAGGYANNQPFGAGSQDPTNYMYNVQLTRWTASIMDGGWGAAGSVTYTKETGTVHLLPTSAKMVNASGTDAFTTCNLDAYQLQQFKGRYVTFSSNFQLNGGETYSDNPYLQVYFGCPYWKKGQAYTLGQGITINPKLTFTLVSAPFTDGETINQATSSASGVIEYYDSVNKIIYLSSVTGTFDTTHTVTGVSSSSTGIPSTVDGVGATLVCIDAGTSGSAWPSAWNTGDGQTTVDNGIIWRAGMVSVSNNPIYNQITMTPGKWYPYMVGAFCPRNATSGTCVVAQRVQTGGGAGTMYLAEPALMVGRQSPRSYVPNNPAEVLIGSSKHTADTVIPTNASSNIYTKWSCVGDVCINLGVTASTSPGWVCTTPGMNNAGTVVWTAKPNL